MKFIVKPPKETFCDSDWVSHIRLVSAEVYRPSRFADPRGSRDISSIYNIHYTVEHVEVFKKPSSVDALATEILGSSVGNLMLEEGKEYLLCGMVQEGKFKCKRGQVKPEGLFQAIAEWNQIPTEFIEEMKHFES